MRRAIFLFISLAILALSVLPGGATACGCGEFKGPVVAHGSSPYGAPWRIKVRHRVLYGESLLVIKFSVGDPNSSGHRVGVPLPVSPQPVFDAVGRREIDEYPESDLSGLTVARVAELQLTMNDGEVLAAKPVLAPPPIRRRFPSLNDLRFFDLFFPQGQEPTVLTAFDRDGHAIGSGKNRGHGVYYP